MARSGIKVVFARVKRAATKAKPYLIPAGPVGLEAGIASLRKSIATLRTLSSRGLQLAAAVAARKAAFAAAKAAKKKAPWRTGRLRMSINPRIKTAFLWNVGTNLKYARFVEEGTKAGTRNGPYIYPDTKKALAFRWRNAPSAVRARFRGRGRRRR